MSDFEPEELLYIPLDIGGRPTVGWASFVKDAEPKKGQPRTIVVKRNGVYETYKLTDVFKVKAEALEYAQKRTKGKP